MQIATKSDRMLVISDLHVGNPYSLAKRNLAGFLRTCREDGWDLCINGDGLEILQANVGVLARDALEIMSELQGLIQAGRRVFYVIGNHDIALEHLLQTSLASAICPFLNVTSGERRIRVEHGHLYDPSFVKHPVLYETLTRLAGPVLDWYPDIYKAWAGYQKLKDRWTRKRARSDLEASVYYEAADRILRRGFDAVIFGHTHVAEEVELLPGKLYVNSGNWLRGTDYVAIDHGHVRLATWKGDAPRSA